MGGVAFSVSMLWAQAMPFVALYLYKEIDHDHVQDALGISNTTSTLPASDDTKLDKTALLHFLSCSITLWLVLNVAFFCTIDLSYAGTFFDLMTASQCAVSCYLASNEDSQKFWWVFGSRLSYSKPIHDDMKEWVKNNIDRWRAEKAAWFSIDWIPDDFLPAEVVVLEGGANRRRSSVSLRELAGFGEDI